MRPDVILGEPSSTADSAIDRRTTLDELFRRAALRRPAAWALIDAPNRRTFADGAPRHVSYAAADRFVTALAGRLHRLELPRDSVIAIQCTNTVESALALLGVLRAGMIAAPLPQLWRSDDMIAALGHVGAKAIIAGGRIGSADLTEVATQVAANLFSIRYVLGLGETQADGVIPLGELFTVDRLDPIVQFERRDDPAAHVAAVTFDTTVRGHVPVARSHAELIAGGADVLIEGGIEQDAAILATTAVGSFAGLALTIVPWLLTGGTLVLHQPFEPGIFAGQCVEHRCQTAVVPGPLIGPLFDAGLFTHGDIRSVLALWRNPERLAKSIPWTNLGAALVDVQAFGEIGLIATRRDVDGRPQVLSPGPLKASRNSADGVTVAEIALTDTGTLALRGPMVPRHSFPPGVGPDSGPTLRADAIGYVDTGFPCRVERNIVDLSGSPAGLVSVGGYRFVPRTLQSQVGKTAILAALPDVTLSHRLAGSAHDRAAVKLVLSGANPLLAGAFRDRHKPRAA